MNDPQQAWHQHMLSQKVICDQCECEIDRDDAVKVRDDDTQETWLLCEACDESRTEWGEELALRGRILAAERYNDDLAAADDANDRRKDEALERSLKGGSP